MAGWTSREPMDLYRNGEIRHSCARISDFRGIVVVVVIGVGVGVGVGDAARRTAFTAFQSTVLSGSSVVQRHSVEVHRLYLPYDALS